MKLNRLFALLVVLTLCVSFLGACASGPAPADASATEATTAAPAAPATEAATEAPADAPADGAAAPFAERVTLEIPIYDRAFEGWDVTDNYYTRWAQETFGEPNNVDLKYVAIGRTTEVQDYTQMLSAGTAPTIIMHYDYPQALAYYSEGVMQTLDWAEIQALAPTLWQYTGAATEQYGSVNGENVFFFAERPMADNYTQLVRKDWVEAAGFTVEEITSLEKMEEVAAKWKELGLGTLSHRLQQNNFTYSYPFREFPMDPVEHALYSELSVADLTTEASKQYLLSLNRQFNAGILYPEFYLLEDETKEKAEFMAGRVGNLGNYLAANTDIITGLQANDPEAEIAILPTGWDVPEGNAPQGRAYWPFGMIMGINFEATDDERKAAFMYLEWMSQPDILFQWQNGVEGETYTLADNGLAVRIPDFTGESAQSANNNKDYWCLVVEGMRYDNEDLFWEANRLQWGPPGYEALADTIIENYLARAQYRVPDAMFTVVIESVAEYKADLNELWKQKYVEIVTTPPDQFEAVYAAACDEFLAAGYQEILDEKQAAIDAGNYIP